MQCDLLDCTSMASKSPGGILKLTNINWHLLIWRAVAQLMGFQSRYWYDRVGATIKILRAQYPLAFALMKPAWQNLTEFTVLSRDLLKITIQFWCSVNVKGILWREVREKRTILKEVSLKISFFQYNTFLNMYFTWIFTRGVYLTSAIFFVTF